MGAAARWFAPWAAREEGRIRLDRIDGSTDGLDIRDVDGVRVFTFDRPDARNALNYKVYDGLRGSLTEAAADDELCAVVITGAGDVFTAGQDLAELVEPPVHHDGKPHGFAPFIDAMQEFDKPLLAAVNGMAVGVGMTMLLHCDIVLVADTARMRAPFVGLGVSPEAGSSLLLPATVGRQRAAEILFTGRWVDARSAVEWGLALEAHPADKLMPAALELAATLAQMPVASLVATKRLLLDADRKRLEEVRAREAQVLATLAGGPANREAVAAFRERRTPDFRGLPPS